MFFHYQLLVILFSFTFGVIAHPLSSLSIKCPMGRNAITQGT